MSDVLVDSSVWIDFFRALTASSAGHALLTRDRDFIAIARVVPLPLSDVRP